MYANSMLKVIFSHKAVSALNYNQLQLLQTNFVMPKP